MAFYCRVLQKVELAKEVDIMNRKDKSNVKSKNEMIYEIIEENEKWFRNKFSSSQDVIIENVSFGKRKMLFLYCDGMVDTAQINKTIIPNLKQAISMSSSKEGFENQLTLNQLQQVQYLNDVVTRIFYGEFIFVIDGMSVGYSVNISKLPQRDPEEPNTEISVRGPRDGFVEDIAINVALIRKRLRSDSMCYEQFSLGIRTHTKVGLLYIQDIVNPETLDEARNRLSTIEVDAVFSANELEEMLSDNPGSVFPIFDYTGRPDYVVSVLLRGRFVILVDGVPTAIIAPSNLSLMFKSPEDVHNSFAYVSFSRLFRLVGIGISLFLPGFYIGIATFHQDQIPLTLLGTMIISRKGVPIPTPVEALIMMALFELFREAGIRLPSAIGQTLGVVGGLIIGTAAIDAGLTSPAMLVVIGITAVATFTVVNQSLVGAVSIVRFGVLAASSLLGIFGFMVSVFIVCTFLATLKSFGLPYLAPISPLSLRDLGATIFRFPVTQILKRPKMLHTIDKRRQGGK